MQFFPDDDDDDDDNDGNMTQMRCATHLTAAKKTALCQMLLPFSKSLISDVIYSQGRRGLDSAVDLLPQ